ncbi:uncharacterized protein LOC135076751 [Ostrinia nubilalis]|uniref:uncharacterized protein LOC135076751 n=1 Tax=Ostrinia nubilalis TaxID=29057 RepID=UPI003082232D
MMSQQRSRKAAGAALEAPRGRQSVVKASGDSVSSNLQAKQPTVRSTSKSKIPKSLRYDLENALVGLCDVWFEEIKPHLVRNNIKVHVHGAGPASGDHRRLPPGAPGCSHLDPGAAPDVHVHGGGPASGGHRRLPPGAPGCSHLDPGAAPMYEPHRSDISLSFTFHTTTDIIMYLLKRR